MIISRPLWVWNKEKQHKVPSLGSVFMECWITQFPLPEITPYEDLQTNTAVASGTNTGLQTTLVRFLPSGTSDLWLLTAAWVYQFPPLTARTSNAISAPPFRIRTKSRDCPWNTHTIKWRQSSQEPKHSFGTGNQEVPSLSPLLCQTNMVLFLCNPSPESLGLFPADSQS